jgi:DNA-binding winged helix-turn-helix (wHTH) protein/TolB-like protein
MVYQFGVFEFDPDSLELRKSGRVVALERQPAVALSRLLADAGEVITREQMIETIWDRDTHVDFDRGLAYCLSQIRGALGDSGSNPRFVQTVPKKGYRLIAPVARVEAVPPASVPAASGKGKTLWIVAGVAFVALLSLLALRVPGSSRERAIVAVSIFDNETGLSEHDRLVAGLSDMVVVRLSQLAPERIAVVGNAEILRQPRNIRNLKAVKENVNAGYVLLGQLQRADDGLRFITHFIRLADGVHLKANRIALADERAIGLEDAVVAEFERAAREHLLK